MLRTVILSAALALGLAAPALSAERPPPPARIVLVGDSTMAPKSGWGDALCAQAKPTLTCVNMAKGGRSSKSYRAEGSWDQVLEALRKKGPWRTTYVFIQFGHNDQPGKGARSSDFKTEFMPNMARYVRDVRAAGGIPVLITPLTRRQFKDGLLIDGLSAWSAAVRKVAEDSGVPLLDLASDSVLAVQMMGPVSAMALAQAPPPPEVVKAAAETGATIEAPKPPAGAPAGQAYFDYTHLGPTGATIFARMIETEIAEKIPDLRAQFHS